MLVRLQVSDGAPSPSKKGKQDSTHDPFKGTYTACIELRMLTHSVSPALKTPTKSMSKLRVSERRTSTGKESKDTSKIAFSSLLFVITYRECASIAQNTSECTQVAEGH
jgi:hypothetical protein